MDCLFGVIFPGNNLLILNSSIILTSYDSIFFSAALKPDKNKIALNILLMYNSIYSIFIPGGEGGFEPSMQDYYIPLAGERFQPLSHLSERGIVVFHTDCLIISAAFQQS